MKKFLLLMMFVLVGAVSHAADTFTISFEDGNNDGIYVMQIDAMGHVTKAPVKVAAAEGGCSTKTAMVDAGGTIWLYFKNGTSELRLARVSKSAPAMSKSILLPYTMESNRGGFVSSTEAPWFVALGLENEIMKGALIDSKGKPYGRTWRLSPRTENSLFNAGIAADGGLAWAIASDATNHTTVYVQGLRADGKPDSRIAGYATREEFQSADLTGPLAGGLRYLFYRKYDGNWGPDNTTSQFYMQPINGTTLEKIGGRRQIDNYPYNCLTGAIAAETNGRFVIFTRQDYSCHGDQVMFQAMDGAGNPSGSMIALTSCAQGFDVGGLDIIQN